MQGGGVNLKKPLTLKIKPVELSVTALHFGSFERFDGVSDRKYVYIGFDGSLKINPGGIEGKGSGIKVYFSVDNDEPGNELDVFVRIQSIAIDLVIPANAESPTILIS